MTLKGKAIKQYIADRRLPRNGIGHVVMGCIVNPQGHAIEIRHHVGCPPDCNRPDHAPIDHGKVADPPLTILNVKAPDRTFRGRKVEGTTDRGNHVEVSPDSYIQLFGTDTRRRVCNQNYDRTFRIGERCEVGSYNLIYTGHIARITKTFVEVVDDCSGETKRLNFYEFSWRNRFFDMERISRHNAEEMMCI